MGTNWIFDLSNFLIFGLKKLGHPRTAPRGNQFGMLGMATAVVTTIVDMNFLPDGIVGWTLIIMGILIGSLIGYIMAVKVEMTGMPEMVALFNGFGGAASALVALSETWKWIETISRTRTGSNCCCRCCRTECPRWMDDTYRFSSSMYKQRVE